MDGMVFEQIYARVSETKKVIERKRKKVTWRKRKNVKGRKRKKVHGERDTKTKKSDREQRLQAEKMSRHNHRQT